MCYVSLKETMSSDILCEFILQRGPRAGQPCKMKCRPAHPAEIERHACQRHVEQIGHQRSEQKAVQEAKTSRPTPPSPAPSESKEMKRDDMEEEMSEQDDETWIPRGAEIIDLPPIDGVEANYEQDQQAESKRDVVEASDEVIINAIRQYYTRFPWLLEAVPPNEFDGPVGEHFKALTKAVEDRQFNSMMITATRDVLAPLVQAVSTKVGQPIMADHWKIACSSAEEELRELYAILQIKYAVEIDRYIGTNARIAMLLGKIAISARTITATTTI